MKETTRMLSIIIPVYNTELYLRECIESILNQNLTNYEIIVINDGSTDESKNIILGYQEQYSFIRYFEQENSGQGTARNVGIEHSRGQYIYFMDSDDYLVEGQLGKMLLKVSENKWDAIFFDGASFQHEDSTELPNRFNYKRNQAYGYYSQGELLMSDLSVHNDLIISPCLYIITRKVFDNSLLRFPEKYKHEDEFFTATLFLYLEEVYHSNEVVFMRRIRQDSTMTNTDKRPSFLGYVNVLSYFERVLTALEFQTAAGKEAYQKKIKQLTKSAYTSYSQIENKETVQTEYQRLNDFARKYNYFDFPTRLYIVMTKYPSLLNRYKNMIRIIKGN